MDSALLGARCIKVTHGRDQEGLGWIGLGHLEFEVLWHQLLIVVIMTVAQANPICGAQIPPGEQGEQGTGLVKMSPNN